LRRGRQLEPGQAHALEVAEHAHRERRERRGLVVRLNHDQTRPPKREQGGRRLRRRQGNAHRTGRRPPQVLANVAHRAKQA